MIIYPTAEMDVIEWTDRMAFLVGELTPILKLEDPENWREWAENLIGEPDLLGQEAPDPRNFDNWREWAMRLFQTEDFTG